LVHTQIVNPNSLHSLIFLPMHVTAVVVPQVPMVVAPMDVAQGVAAPMDVVQGVAAPMDVAQGVAAPMDVAQEGVVAPIGMAQGVVDKDAMQPLVLQSR